MNREELRRFLHRQIAEACATAQREGTDETARIDFMLDELAHLDDTAAFIEQVTG